MAENPLPLRRKTMGERVIATSAFRMLGWIEGNLSDPASHAAAMTVFKAVVARWGDRFDRVRLADARPGASARRSRTEAWRCRRVSGSNRSTARSSPRW